MGRATGAGGGDCIGCMQLEKDKWLHYVYVRGRNRLKKWSGAGKESPTSLLGKVLLKKAAMMRTNQPCLCWSMLDRHTSPTSKLCLSSTAHGSGGGGGGRACAGCDLQRYCNV